MERTCGRSAPRAGAGFNVRYRNGIPGDALTPDGLMRALAQYVDFGAASGLASQAGVEVACQGAGAGVHIRRRICEGARITQKGSAVGGGRDATRSRGDGVGSEGGEADRPQRGRIARMARESPPAS
jgi:hypothetical protein